MEHDIFNQMRKQLKRITCYNGLKYLLSLLNNILNEINIILYKRTDYEIERISMLAWELAEEYKKRHYKAKTEEELDEEEIQEEIPHDIILLQEAIKELDIELEYYDYNLEHLKEYELMAGLSLNFLKFAIDYSDKTLQEMEMECEKYSKMVFVYLMLIQLPKQHAIEYTLQANQAIEIAKQQKTIDEFLISQEYLVKQTRYNTLKQRSKQGLDKRHRTNRATKNNFLNEYATEYAKAQQVGIKLSKNAFAQTYSNKYGYQTSTLRKWLKNFEPNIS